MAVRTLLIAILAAGACAANASADGLPVLGIDVGSSGVTTASGSARIVTLPDGTGTTVARVARHGGRVLCFAHLP
jgi:ferric-dicitrate binding protein FerR (iron transport regulator)